MSKRKKEEIIQPIDASLDELVDAVLFSKRKIVAKPVSPFVLSVHIEDELLKRVVPLAEKLGVTLEQLVVELLEERADRGK